MQALPGVVIKSDCAEHRHHLGLDARFGFEIVLRIAGAIEKNARRLAHALMLATMPPSAARNSVHIEVTAPDDDVHQDVTIAASLQVWAERFQVDVRPIWSMRVLKRNHQRRLLSFKHNTEQLHHLGRVAEVKQLKRIAKCTYHALSLIACYVSRLLRINARLRDVKVGVEKLQCEANLPT